MQWKVRARHFVALLRIRNGVAGAWFMFSRFQIKISLNRLNVTQPLGVFVASTMNLVKVKRLQFFRNGPT